MSDAPERDGDRSPAAVLSEGDDLVLTSRRGLKP
jgi:hypothetical protein